METDRTANGDERQKKGKAHEPAAEDNRLSPPEE
jgi:hypothetical protein